MIPGLSLDWWLLPISGSSEHHIASWAAWHARSMVLAWAILMPIGALFARYWKLTPRQKWPESLDNKTWWRVHQGCQNAGFWLMVVGVVLAWNQGSHTGVVAQWHHWLGWGIVGIAALQVASGMFRGSRGGPGEADPHGDHYDMSARRRRFERWHKSAGWIVLAFSIVVIALGLVTADAPRWMPGTLAVWWLTLAALAWYWQKQGRCIDTYEAIWGEDRAHPGNRLKPIGFGVRRVREQPKRRPPTSTQ